jgi:hypothetical protein
MNTPALTRPHLTTLWGGGGILVVALLSWLAALNVAVPLTADYFLPFGSRIPSMVSDTILLGAVAILALGIRGESGIVGRSVVGKIALLVFGLGGWAFQVLGLLPIGQGQDFVAVGASLTIALTVAVAAAAVVVVRARVLSGFARWALVPVAVCNAVAAGLSYIPGQDLTYVIYIGGWIRILLPLSLTVLGFSYLLYGQSAAIRRRLHVLNQAW